MHRDPEILPKIAELSGQHGVEPATVIALLAMNALASVDFSGLTFWANALETRAINRPN
ncbi:MAG: hypothetical protein K2P94_05750 [Rhodospirillaceae bacterium]|nr:hypothetical protein [Rhodospirillaceae bacterium]